MKKIPREQLKELMAVYIGNPEGLPEVDLEGQTEFVEGYLQAGAPEASYLFYICNISLRILSLIIKRKSFSRLDHLEKQKLISSISGSRNPLIRGITILLGLPIFYSYYRREDVRVPLGFDSKGLKEEANLRTVSRDRELPPKKEESS